MRALNVLSYHLAIGTLINILYSFALPDRHIRYKFLFPVYAQGYIIRWFLNKTHIWVKYWVTRKLPQINAANHATFPKQTRKITVQICGNFWVTQYNMFKKFSPIFIVYTLQENKQDFVDIHQRNICSKMTFVLG